MSLGRDSLPNATETALAVWSLQYTDDREEVAVSAAPATGPRLRSGGRRHLLRLFALAVAFPPTGGVVSCGTVGGSAPPTRQPSALAPSTPPSPLAEARSPTAAPSATAAPPPEPTRAAPLAEIEALLPSGARLLSQVSADLDGDGRAETAILAGVPAAAEGMSFTRVELLVLTAGSPGPSLLWRSGELIGERVEPLRAQDVNGDGRPELVSVQSMGAAGQTLYLASCRAGRCSFLRPSGGHFDGTPSFGEVAVCLVDEDGDGSLEIHAGYGPAATSTDVYRWDGSAYVHDRTVVDS